MLGHMAGAIRRQWPVASQTALAGALANLAAVFISHGHWDHLDVASLRALPGRPALIVPFGLGRIVAKAAPGIVHEIRPGGRMQVGALTFEAIHAEHGHRRSLFTTSDDALGVLIAGSTSVYFAGDTELFPAMTDLAGRVDVALLPVGGWGPRLGAGHMNPVRAAEAAERIAPAVAIPIHWGTLYPLGLRRLARSRFERPGPAFRTAVAARAPGVEVRILAPGESMELGRGSIR
jgi:L-ascorbate metabolism protein UlaG (beta-lactamase superfamily)